MKGNMIRFMYKAFLSTLTFDWRKTMTEEYAAKLNEVMKGDQFIAVSFEKDAITLQHRTGKHIKFKAMLVNGEVILAPTEFN
jgi:uncharacterized ubiquitin-like protein YukD